MRLLRSARAGIGMRCVDSFDSFRELTVDGCAADDDRHRHSLTVEFRYKRPISRLVATNSADRPTASGLSLLTMLMISSDGTCLPQSMTS